MLPTFISEIVNSSLSSDPMKENCMKIIQILGDGIFSLMSPIKKAELQPHFIFIFNFCQFVLKNSNIHSLILSTLIALTKISNCIPPEQFFKDQFLNFVFSQVCFILFLFSFPFPL